MQKDQPLTCRMSSRVTRNQLQAGGGPPVQPLETISMSDAREGRKLKEGIGDSVAEGGASLCARNIWPGTASLWPFQPSNAATWRFMGLSSYL